jgi:hypothetical protein
MLSANTVAQNPCDNTIPPLSPPQDPAEDIIAGGAADAMPAVPDTTARLDSEARTGRRLTYSFNILSTPEYSLSALPVLEGLNRDVVALNGKHVQATPSFAGREPQYLQCGFKLL